MDITLKQIFNITSTQYNDWTICLNNANEEGIYSFEENASRLVPAWLEKDIEKLSGKVVALPSREDVDIPVEEHLIVELYSK